MNTILLNMLIFIIKQVIGSHLFEHILELVQAQANTSLSGEEKRTAVQKEIQDIRGDLAGVVQSTSSTLINLAIEAAVVAVKG